ncbi:MAG: class I SAM-dependent methyltransferase [Chloroflexota bacterium]
MTNLTSLLARACDARLPLFDPPHETAFRLFNGFLEGCPGLAMDVYASTLVVFNLAEPPEALGEAIHASIEFIPTRLPWLKTVLLKTHHAPRPEARRGRLLTGSAPDRKVHEHGVWYALDLTMHQDASLYLDTRNLRKWAIENLRGKSALNAFAYTGSLGVAAMAGGASRVVHLDLNLEFLNLAKTSYTLNGFPIRRADFIAGDFFAQVSRMKRSGACFDCVILDPPFFSTTPRGRLDLNTDSARLINKVRPLVNDGGWLVTVNNALYVSGKDYLSALEVLCADGYLKIVDLIPVPEDFTGFEETRIGIPVTDPSPFNHSTKIVVLEVRRKTIRRV